MTDAMLARLQELGRLDSADRRQLLGINLGSLNLDSTIDLDRLAAKLTNAVVEKEQTKWREQNAPIPRGALEERLGRYCANQVKAMHAEHHGKAGNP